MSDTATIETTEQAPEKDSPSSLWAGLAGGFGINELLDSGLITDLILILARGIF